MIRLTVSELASVSGVGIATIKRIEASTGLPSAHVKTLYQIKLALEQAGVEFLGTPDDRPGVRLLTKK